MAATSGDDAGDGEPSVVGPADYGGQSTVVNPCPICLDSIKGEAYLDQCFHKFCYQCIMTWSDLSSQKNGSSASFVQCPLCKRENCCIIFGINGDFFQQHYIDKGKRFAMTEAHKYRLLCYSQEQGKSGIYLQYDVNRYWRCQRYLRHNKWLESWLRREVQALIQEEDVDIILHHILGVFEAFVQKYKGESVKYPPEQVRAEWHSSISDAARPFLSRAAERFVNEVELFLISGLNITAFDEVYLQYLGLDTSGGINETPQTPTLQLFDWEFDDTD